VKNRHNRPIGAHFHLWGAKLSYFGKDLDEAVGEPMETIAGTAVWEGSAEHLHDMLSGE